MDKQWCLGADSGLLEPVRTYFFDITPKDAAERGGFGEERYENIAFQDKVYQSFQEIYDPLTWKVKLFLKPKLSFFRVFFIINIFREWMLHRAKRLLLHG